MAQNTDRTYTAYVATGSTPTSEPPTTDVIATSGEVTIQNVGWVGGIEMGAETLGPDYFSLSATIDTHPDTYILSLYDQNGARVCSQTAYDTGCSALVVRPSSGSVTYTAYVAAEAPSYIVPSTDIRAMSSVTMASDGTITTTANGISLEDLVAEMNAAGPGALDDLWFAFGAAGLGTHNLQSTATDQQLAYDAAIALGKTAEQAFAAAAGGSVLLWFAHKFFSPTPAQPVVVNPPPPPPPPPTPSQTKPQPAAPTMSYLDLITEDFIEHNPKTLTWPDAQNGARTCIFLTQYAIATGALTGSAADNPCANQTVFLPGGEFPETTQHNWDAIISHPAWINLNWVNQLDRGATLNREWYRPYVPCAGNITGTSGLSCDEYPFYSSAQSGPGASLRLVDHSQNIKAGRRYQTFSGRCKLVSDPVNTPFLVIPMYFDHAPRTFEVCP
jgi:hypothetical protein